LHHREQEQRLQEKLRREAGPVVLAALRDPDITEVMLNPDGSLWVESQRDGMRDTGARMSGIQAENLIGTVASMLGTVVNAGSPIVEGELPLDGNRFEGILPPVSTAPVFVIRKRADLVYTLDDYVTAEIMEPWNTGHPGGITTVHANSAAAALVRLDTLIQEAGVPPQPQLVVEAVDLLVFIARTAEGRCVRELATVTGCDPTTGYRLESLT